MAFSLVPLSRDQSEAPTGAELLVIGTKNEDNNIFPQGKIPGNRVFFESILVVSNYRKT